MTFVSLIAVGFVVGTVVGLTGVGGASIMTPLLIAFGVNPLVAIGSDLAMTVPTRLYGAILHYRQRTVDLTIVKALCAGGIPASLAGIVGLHWVYRFVDAAQLRHWVAHAVGASLILSAFLIVVSLWKQRESAQHHTAPRPIRTWRLWLTGAAVGLVVTLTSIGSGSLTLPLLTIIAPGIALPDLIGSDIAFSAMLVPVAAAGHWSLGDVNPVLALNLLIGAMPGTYVGAKCCRALHQRWLRPAVALVLVFVATKLLAV